MRIGPQLPEIDPRAEKRAGIKAVRRATASIAAADVPWAGIDDQTVSVGDCNIAQPGGRRRSGLRDVECNLKLLPGRFFIGEMNGPADLGIVCGELSDGPACRVQAIHTKPC